MAKFETVLKDRTFDEWIQRIENGILGRSASATLEDKSDFIAPDGRSKVSVRVFERYSAIGGNRVSLNLTFYQDETGEIHLSAITSGGSQAVSTVYFRISKAIKRPILVTLLVTVDSATFTSLHFQRFSRS